jgi:hypothetical protein
MPPASMRISFIEKRMERRGAETQRKAKPFFNRNKRNEEEQDQVFLSAPPLSFL